MSALHIIPGEFSTFTIAIAILSGFILFFGYVSMFIKEKCFLSEAFVALIVGIIAGPLVSNGFDPSSWQDFDEITKELTRCILAIQVMAVGIELPKHYLKKEWRTMFMLLIPIMLFMWLVSGLFIWWLIPPVNYLHALVIAACVCPTDPILANSVVKGRFAEKHVPAHIRNALSAESGANDGMGFPFLFLALFLISEHSVGTAIGKWIYITVLFQIALSCVIGLVVGYVARKILQWSEKNHLIDKPSFLCFAIALALFLMSMTGFSGSDDLLACFVAGNAFSWDDWFRQETEEAHFQEVIDMMLNLAVFVYIGAIIPWKDFGNQALGLTPWRLVVMALLILIFRRLPAMIILKPVMPAMKTYREAIFSGWFGPMGVGAVFLSMIAKEELQEIYHDSAEKPVTIEIVSPVVLFIVLSSTLVHGTTIPLFKIGNRIRTRTLSIASTGSGQIRRLPKLQFGQHVNLRKSEDKEKKHQDSEAMLQLKRNTLANTIQHDPVIHTNSADELIVPKIIKSEPNNIYATTIDIHDNSDDDELNEEDFLPDESDETEVGGYTPPEQQQQPSISHQSTPTPTISTSETQGIRFVEPVHPRSGSNHQLLHSPDHRIHHGHHHSTSSSPTSADTDKNEGTVSSIRSWLRHNKPSPNSAEGDNHENGEEVSHSSPSNHHGLRHFFKRHHPLKEQQTVHIDAMEALKSIFAHLTHEQREEMISLSGLHLNSQRVEIWDEPHHVVVEDNQDAASHAVIDKGQPNWEQALKEKLEEIQTKIDQEEK